MAIVDISNSLVLGASDDLKEYYRQSKPEMIARQNKFCFQRETTLREAKYPLKESIPFPSLWPFGKPRSFKTFKDRILNITHRNWNLAIPYSRWDEEDEVIRGDLQTHLQGIAARFRQMIDQLMVDHLIGTASMGQTLANAFDGAAMTSATDGDGNDRFQVSGGNQITVPLNTEADFIDALLKAQQRWLQFKDTEGQPFFTADEVSIGKMTLVYGPNKVIPATKALEGTYIHANANLPAASENILVGKFDVWPNQRLTGNNCFVILDHPFYKPWFWLKRTSGPEIQKADQSNWDRALEIGEFAVMGHTREGVEVMSPHSIIKLVAA